MKALCAKIEALLELGGTKKDIVLIAISGIALFISLTGAVPLPFDAAWIAIILCGVPIILEAVIGLVTAFDIKADVLVSIALIASVCIGENFAAGEVAFIMQIGDVLKSGVKHDGRAPDYDDWKLNGDILIWDDVLDCALEVSSMGIRVDAASMDSQLREAGCDERRKYPFHQMVLDGTLPLTIGGGIGQSRLCMLLLGKAHIGEVQVSVWPKDMVRECEEHNIHLL